MHLRFDRRVILWPLLLGASAALMACSTVDRASSRVARAITPYKIEVVQGNFISSEQVNALAIGMSRQQVREILGTPLLADPFHADRWDYVFTIKRQGVPEQERRLTVFFRNDLLDRYDGDEMPTEAEFVSAIDTKVGANVKPRELEATPEELARYAKPKDDKATEGDTAGNGITSPVDATPPPGGYPPIDSSPR